MNKRQIGKSDLYASELGFGCMSLSPGLGKENESIVKTALEHGINYFDTADLYQFGWNEELIGKLLKDVRQDIILATKGGNEWTESQDSWNWNPSKKYIKSAFKESLRRLKTDYIDLYQLHGGTIEDPMDETIEAFDELVSEGLVRYYGISSIRPNTISYYAEHSNIQSVMMQYSLLDRRPEELFPYLEKKGISVIARGPVAKGWLSEKAFEKNPEDKFLSYSGLDIQSKLERVKKLIPQDEKLTQTALKFILSHSVISTAVAGASSVEQLLENIHTFRSPEMTEDVRKELEDLFPAEFYESHRVQNR
ncbi:aldo/keto reductase [Fictibacillus phosphorivorans]|uniref:aldo/keto reductase n=1 Tax=Fictibacillus phosphorivorans TaxID=1221500 RepID=UPI00203A46EB|nr:aldo/keto reductase [Fictibacillus phosphorivorans]MCM3719676.1 aldo/keto reductase [Fictibacillus phosphorivorans]MCM3777367.1 aldo/keto reductase [Fictibacillus phosphorivorans]